MLPSRHIVGGLLFSIVMYYLFPQIQLIGAILIFLSSFLIDVDHYLFYITTKKDLNLRNAYWYFRKMGDDIFHKHKKRKPVLCLFHAVEFLIVLFIASFYFEPLSRIFIGFVFHLCLDVYEMVRLHGTREFSLIHYLQSS